MKARYIVENRLSAAVGLTNPAVESMKSDRYPGWVIVERRGGREIKGPFSSLSEAQARANEMNGGY
ncbi:hypothetical protein [Halotalea alkalilenta]|uniref:hypothetical protein n=1 Tax=Halotalea alkalilenta TaxID=376489 RepID=UPI000482E3B3|nr:hypothetical protein [Halotalea alkalilenta]